MSILSRLTATIRARWAKAQAPAISDERIARLNARLAAAQPPSPEQIQTVASMNAALMQSTAPTQSFKDKFMSTIEDALAAIDAKIAEAQTAFNTANAAIACATAEAETHQQALAALNSKKEQASKVLADLTTLLSV